MVARPNRFSLGCQSDRFEKIIQSQNKRKNCFKNKSARKSANEKSERRKTSARGRGEKVENKEKNVCMSKESEKKQRALENKRK